MALQHLDSTLETLHFNTPGLHGWHRQIYQKDGLSETVRTSENRYVLPSVRWDACIHLRIYPQFPLRSIGCGC
jgi:hypothetical protein